MVYFLPVSAIPIFPLTVFYEHAIVLLDQSSIEMRLTMFQKHP